MSAAWWAVLGVEAMLAEAVVRLGRLAYATLSTGLSVVEWAACGVVVGAFVWFEGYRALHLRFAPRVIERARAVTAERRLYRALAPFYALSLFGGSRREIARGWLVVVLICAAVLLVRALPAPWRGIVDAGVAAALALGCLSIAVRAARAL